MRYRDDRSDYKRLALDVLCSRRVMTVAGRRRGVGVVEGFEVTTVPRRLGDGSRQGASPPEGPLELAHRPLLLLLEIGGDPAPFGEDHPALPAELARRVLEPARSAGDVGEVGCAIRSGEGSARRSEQEEGADPVGELAFLESEGRVVVDGGGVRSLAGGGGGRREGRKVGEGVNGTVKVEHLGNRIAVAVEGQVEESINAAR